MSPSRLRLFFEKSSGRNLTLVAAYFPQSLKYGMRGAMLNA